MAAGGAVFRTGLCGWNGDAARMIGVESPASAGRQIPLTALRGKKSPDKSPDIALAESPDSDRGVAVKC
jgi:hypothetical protein